MVTERARICGILGIAAALLAARLGEPARATTNPASEQSELIPRVGSIVLDPIEPATLYAGTSAGVFKSVDSAESWRRASDGLPDLGVSLAINPLVPSILYAATRTGGFRSEDGAASWTAASEGLPPGGVGPIVVDPQNPSRLFAATPFGIFRSLDGARSWNRRPTPISGVGNVVIDPKNPQTLYVIGGIRPTLIFKSTDGGDTWTRATNGFPVGPSGPLVGRALAIDPVTPSTLYAASTIGIYKSLDGGSQWSPINQGLPCITSPPICPEPGGFVVDPVFPARVYARVGSLGLFRSINGGGLWQSSNTGLEPRRVGPLAVDPKRPETIYAGTDRGVFKSENAGATWNESSRGLRAVQLILLSGQFSVELLAVDPRTGRSAPGDPTLVNDFFGFFSLPALTGDAANPEVFVKLLDGFAINRHFWIFYGGLTDLEYTLIVTDRRTGQTRTFHKDFGSACGGFDAAAFPG